MRRKKEHGECSRKEEERRGGHSAMRSDDEDSAPVQRGHSVYVDEERGGGPTVGKPIWRCVAVGRELGEEKRIIKHFVRRAPGEGKPDCRSAPAGGTACREWLARR